MNQVVSAGREAKEDLLVLMARDPDPGLVVEVNSSVKSLYGRHIEALVRTTALDLGLRGVRITVKDQGALDFVIMARVEAAARALDPTLDKAVLPPLYDGHDYDVARDRMRRSRLYLPGNQPDLMCNAGLFHPDGVILDLEDAVAPAQKPAACILVRNALRVISFDGAERMVRINQVPRGLDDLPHVVPHGVHTILIPKAEGPEQVLAVVERVQTLTDRPLFLMPIVESAAGVLRAYAIASAHPWVVALAFGAEDFTRDIGAARTDQGTESFVARSQIVLAARAAGVQPIDTVYSDVGNEAGLLSATREAIAMGFDGKGCIHPRQIRTIHEAFRPSDREVLQAVRIKTAMDEAEKRGDGVIALGSKMIDPPVVARALRVLRLADFYKIDADRLAKEVSA